MARDVLYDGVFSDGTTVSGHRGRMEKRHGADRNPRRGPVGRRRAGKRCG
jgi:hypothetical protein